MTSILGRTLEPTRAIRLGNLGKNEIGLEYSDDSEKDFFTKKAAEECPFETKGV